MTFKNPGLSVPVLKKTIFIVTVRSHANSLQETPAAWFSTIDEARKSVSSWGSTAQIRVGRFSQDGKEIRTI